MPKNPIIQKQSNSLKTHLKTLNASHIKVCVATKYATVSQMEELYNEGYRIFGENKLQDALEKQKALSHLPDIQWHFIGHLQRNKAKKAVENFDVIQSVDSLKLLEKIDNLSKEIQKITTCYIQVNSGNDLNKFGFSLEDCLNNKEKILSFPNISVQGIMCIAPQGQTDQSLTAIFNKTAACFNSVFDKSTDRELSMGMSQDYALAIQSGATMIRIGRVLFND